MKLSGKISNIDTILEKLELQVACIIKFKGEVDEKIVKKIGEMVISKLKDDTKITFEAKTDKSIQDEIEINFG